MGDALTSFQPVLLYLAILLGLVSTMLVLAHAIGPRKKTAVKQMPYESGMDPVGDAHQRFDVRFYLVAISFLVFDVELLVLYPWAVIAYGKERVLGALGPTVFWVVLAFLAALVVAYAYDWRKGVFKWR